LGGGFINPTESVGVGVGVGGDDVWGCYDPVLVVGLNVQNEIRPYNPPPQKKRVGL